MKIREPTGDHFAVANLDPGCQIGGWPEAVRRGRADHGSE
jgi:hypothetical protein